LLVENIILGINYAGGKLRSYLKALSRFRDTSRNTRATKQIKIELNLFIYKMLHVPKRWHADFKKKGKVVIHLTLAPSTLLEVLS